MPPPETATPGQIAVEERVLYFKKWDESRRSAKTVTEMYQKAQLDKDNYKIKKRLPPEDVNLRTNRSSQDTIYVFLWLCTP